MDQLSPAANGPVDVAFSIADAIGKPLWAETVHLRVVNTSDLAHAAAESMRRHGTPIMIDGAVDAMDYDYSDASLVPWFDRSDAQADINRRLNSNEISAIEADHLRRFVEDGFLILKGAVGMDLLRTVNSELDDVIAKKYSGYEYGSSQRLEQLHFCYPGIRQIWDHPTLSHYLRLIFKSAPRNCQTLTYIFGSQQGAHQDTIFLTPFPAGYMCGVWVAIEDVKPDSGELAVYRGSHKLPRVYMRSLCERGDPSFGEKVDGRWQEMLHAGNFERIVYRAKAGDVLIWHENLMHEGSPRIDKSLSRRSIFSHVFADGAVAFYDAQGVPGYMQPLG